MTIARPQAFKVESRDGKCGIPLQYIYIMDHVRITNVKAPLTALRPVSWCYCKLNPFQPGAEFIWEF